MSENIYAVRTNQLRSRMQQGDRRAYLIPMNDFHGSEYIGEYFKTIAWFSGFTGSAATLLVTESESFLWTDGRYFLQAEEQLAGTGIRLMKMGEADVPTGIAYIAGYLQECKQAGKTLRIGFDVVLILILLSWKMTGISVKVFAKPRLCSFGYIEVSLPV